MKAQNAIQSGDDLHQSRNHRHLTIEVARVTTGKTKKKVSIIIPAIKSQLRGSSSRSSIPIDMEVTIEGALVAAVKTARETTKLTQSFRVKARAHHSLR